MKRHKCIEWDMTNVIFQEKFQKKIMEVTEKIRNGWIF
jgi:hypothetical protein